MDPHEEIQRCCRTRLVSRPCPRVGKSKACLVSRRCYRSPQRREKCYQRCRRANEQACYRFWIRLRRRCNPGADARIAKNQSRRSTPESGLIVTVIERYERCRKAKQQDAVETLRGETLTNGAQEAETKRNVAVSPTMILQSNKREHIFDCRTFMATVGRSYPVLRSLCCTSILYSSINRWSREQWIRRSRVLMRITLTRTVLYRREREFSPR